MTKRYKLKQRFVTPTEIEYACYDKEAENSQGSLQLLEDKLNHQDKRIKELESENKQLKERLEFQTDLIDGTCNSVRMKQLHKIIQEMVTND